MDKTYCIELYGKIFKLMLARSTYTYGNRLAVLAFEEDGERFASISVNIPEEMLTDEKACCFIDTNNCPWAPAFLEKYELAEFTGNIGFSGFCVYPEYRFDLTKLKEF